MTFGTIVLGFVTLQRASELVLARYNTVRLLNRGALEIAPGHYWLLVAMHGAWLVALWIWGRNQPVNLLWLSVFVILQVLRVWVIASLGSNWTTRIIVLPGAPLVSTGAYRFMSHPNYVVVACEIVALSLALSRRCQSKILNTWSGHRTAQIDPEKCRKINGRKIRF